MGLKDKLNAAKARGDAYKQQKNTDKLTNKLITDLGHRGEKLLAQNLDDDEQVLAKLKGNFGQGFVVTNKHVFIVKWGFQSGSTFGGKCVSYAYPNISALQIKQQAMQCLVQVLTPATQDNNKLSYWGGRGGKNSALESDSAVSYFRQDNVLFQEAVNLAKQEIAKAHGNNSTAPDDDITKLEKLARLKQQGIITEAEFAAKKKQLLGL